MSEIDPFLDRVGQGADYLRGFMRTPLRRGMAVAGGFVLLAGSLSACGGSPDARAEGTQAGVTIESETPDNADISPEAGDATGFSTSATAPDVDPAPTASELMGETLEPAPSPVEVVPQGPTTSPGSGSEIPNRQYLELAINNSTGSFVVSCVGSEFVRANSQERSRSEVDARPGDFEVLCGDGGDAEMRLVRDVDEVVGSNILIILTDSSQAPNALNPEDIGPDKTDIPNTAYHEIANYRFGLLSSCMAFELKEGAVREDAFVKFWSQGVTSEPATVFDCPVVHYGFY